MCWNKSGYSAAIVPRRNLCWNWPCAPILNRLNWWLKGSRWFFLTLKGSLAKLGWTKQLDGDNRPTYQISSYQARGFARRVGKVLRLAVVPSIPVCSQHDAHLNGSVDFHEQYLERRVQYFNCGFPNLSESECSKLLWILETEHILKL